MPKPKSLKKKSLEKVVRDLMIEDSVREEDVGKVREETRKIWEALARLDGMIRIVAQKCNCLDDL